MIEVNCEWSDAGPNGITNDSSGLDLAQLIAELEGRPVLYDRTLHYSVFGQTEVLRGWSEVAALVGAKRTECLRAWKRMLRTFLCLQQQSERVLEQWSYYSLMQFIVPYVRNGELIVYDDLDHIDETLDPNDDDNILIDDDDDGDNLVTEDTDSDDDAAAGEFVEQHVVSSTQQQQQHQPQQTTTTSVAAAVHQPEQILPATIKTEEQKMQLPELSSAAAAAAEIKHCTDLGTEELFLLSFAPNLMRLSARQNAYARMRILEELYKLEFE